jgi:hypothetical protein
MQIWLGAMLRLGANKYESGNTVRRSNRRFNCARSANRAAGSNNGALNAAGWPVAMLVSRRCQKPSPGFPNIVVHYTADLVKP